MTPLILSEIIHAVGGQPPHLLPANPVIHAICTDSRHMLPRALFVAIKGDQHNGHDKLAEAARGGALAALIDEPRAPIGILPLIPVENTRHAMGRLAAHLRGKFRGKVIAIAGSNGKTSTKYLVGSILETRLPGSISPKSFNNDIGVPLAVFGANNNDDYLVLEIGTNHPGEVAALSRMTRPDIAVITSISPEHLEGLGDLEGVRREEASIITGLNPGGTLIYNADDEMLAPRIAEYPGRRVSFGSASSNNLFATDVRCTESGIRFLLNYDREVFVPMLGRHVASNALAAIAVAREMQMSDDAIIDAIARAHVPEMRLQLERINGLTLLNDAYNANPQSLRAAIETVCALPATGRRIAVVGDMLELGASAEKYHREAGEFAASSKLDVLICVGPRSKVIADAACGAGLDKKAVRHFPDVAAAVRSLPASLRNGDLVLFKASRGVELERVVKAVQTKPTWARIKP